MIELIFVIVVLGILAAVAFPRLAATRTDAEIAKGRADVATIRSAIVSERQTQLIKGENSYIPKLSLDTNTTLFTGDGNRTLLMYGIKEGSGSGHWQKTGDQTYVYKVGETGTTFTYYPTDSGSNKAGTFTCTSGSGYCNKLVD